MRLVFASAALSVALAGVAAVASASDVPAGFAASPKLAAAASFVAGKPIAVLCANTEYDWKQFLAATGRAGQEVNGSAIPGSATISLSPTVCTNLRTQLRHPPVRAIALGPSILGVVHEAIHARGERDEGITDCAAVHEMARVAVKFFGVKPGKQLRALMAATWQYRTGEPAVYRTVC